MKQHIYFPYILIVVVITAAGCSREQRPEGFPRLYSCAITITQEGAPVSDARVSLVGPESARWAVGGITNNAGTAEIRTHGFAGAPKGQYKIVLEKLETEGRGQITDESGRPTGWEDMRIYSLVDKKYEKAEDTPLEIDIQGAVRQTFEIDKSERRLVETIRQGMP